VSERTGHEAAWGAVHESLPARWCVGHPSYDPGVVRSDGYRGAWSVTARGPHPGRGKAPQTVTGTGVDEIEALQDLVDRLTGVPKPDGGRLDELRRRLRLAYVEGAETWAVDTLGRTLSSDELGRVLGSYTGS
jgi:hypothetical protein